ncbi:MAG TPA: hypothetical protein VHS09_10865, partial [Polyangiaceae bacterium]|nr:hypothetical protein [Polyangiaceae bacterium]
LARALADRVGRGKHRALLIGSVDGVEAARSPLAPVFAAVGFTATIRGLLKRGPGGAGRDVEDGPSVEAETSLE